MVRFSIRALIPLVAALANPGLAATIDERALQSNNVGALEARESQWPYGPFKTKGRDIVNQKGEKISWAGINWPMSGKPATTSPHDRTLTRVVVS